MQKNNRTDSKITTTSFFAFIVDIIPVLKSVLIGTPLPFTPIIEGIGLIGKLFSKTNQKDIAQSEAKKSVKTSTNITSSTANSFLRLGINKQDIHSGYSNFENVPSLDRAVLLYAQDLSRLLDVPQSRVENTTEILKPRAFCRT